MDIEWGRILAALITIAVVGFFVWNFIPQNDWQKVAKFVYDRPRVVFVLLDFSNSTWSMRGSYAADFQKILDSLKAGDRLIVDRITANTLAQSTFPVNEELPQYGIFDQRGNPVYDPVNQKELAGKKKSIQAKVDRMFSTGAEGQATPIMDATQLAQRVFDTYRGTGAPVLVIFSDMVEVSDGYSFETQTLTPRNIESIIAKKESAGELPKLNGVKVYVVGAGAGQENSDITSLQWLGIQNFWLSYFAATGADLSKDRYGAALLEF